MLYFCFNYILSLIFFPWLGICETSLMVYLLSQSNPIMLALSIYPDTGNGFPFCCSPCCPWLCHPPASLPDVTPAAAQTSHSPAQAGIVSVSEAWQEWEFFCSSRELIICYAQALTSVLLWLCAPFWHCIIQSIWHRTGENENSRKLIPQTINFISKSPLQNIAWKGGGSSFSSSFTHQITQLLHKP